MLGRQARANIKSAQFFSWHSENSVMRRFFLQASQFLSSGLFGFVSSRTWVMCKQQVHWPTQHLSSSPTVISSLVESSVEVGGSLADEDRWGGSTANGKSWRVWGSRWGMGELGRGVWGGFNFSTTWNASRRGMWAVGGVGDGTVVGIVKILCCKPTAVVCLGGWGGGPPANPLLTQSSKFEGRGVGATGTWGDSWRCWNLPCIYDEMNDEMMCVRVSVKKKKEMKKWTRLFKLWNCEETCHIIRNI